MKKLGIKIWTRDVVKNRNFFEQAVAAVKNKDFDYLELFVFPNSYNDTAEVIRRELKGCPTIIHNSHSAYGFDAGDADCLAGNLRDVGDSQKFADMLNAEIIIVHAGCGCEERHLEETIRRPNALTINGLPSRICRQAVPSAVKRFTAFFPSRLNE